MLQSYTVRATSCKLFNQLHVCHHLISYLMYNLLLYETIDLNSKSCRMRLMVVLPC